MFIETDLKLRHILIWILESFMNTGPGDFLHRNNSIQVHTHTNKTKKRKVLEGVSGNL